MKTYNIIISNDFNIEIENTIVMASNETEALIKYLKENDNILNSDDTITVTLI